MCRVLADISVLFVSGLWIDLSSAVQASIEWLTICLCVHHLFLDNNSYCQRLSPQHASLQALEAIANALHVRILLAAHVCWVAVSPSSTVTISNTLHCP